MSFIGSIALVLASSTGLLAQETNSVGVQPDPAEPAENASPAVTPQPFILRSL